MRAEATARGSDHARPPRIVSDVITHSVAAIGQFDLARQGRSSEATDAPTGGTESVGSA